MSDAGPARMPALTIWQPWASLISAGAKPYEWRGWEAPSRFVGRRVAIHAGARPVKRPEVQQLLFDLIHGREELTSLNVETALPLLQRWSTSPGMLPLSSVVCTAVLGTPITAAEYAQQRGIKPHDSDRIDHTKWGWPLTDIEVLEPFVPAKGAQGFWWWARPACASRAASATS